MSEMASARIAMPEAFLYTGQEGDGIPEDVTRVRVDPSAIRIPQHAFQNLKKLEEVELCEGLLEIGAQAFCNCVSLRRITIPYTVVRIPDYAFHSCEKLEEVELREGLLEIGASAFSYCGSLSHILIPNTVRVIGAAAFFDTALSSIDLPDSLVHIGACNFSHTRLQHVRIPPLVTEIPGSAFPPPVDIDRARDRVLFSVELPEGINRIKNHAFHNCHSLRNISVPSNSVIEEGALFRGESDLSKLFASESRTKRELQHRFDGLPIHRMVYYQSYHTAETALENLNAAIDPRAGLRRKLRSKLNPTGKLQDCLGMTPLHILACSAKQNLALYRLIVENYPENLIAEDKWGALPLLYALWGDAPSEIIQFLVESHKARYPSHELNWGEMMETLSIGSNAKTVKNLLDMQRNSFHDQSIEWNKVLVKVLVKLENTGITCSHTLETYRFLLHCSISGRLNSIGVKQWRDIIMKKINCCTDRDSIYLSLLDYEAKYGKLKEATSMLELMLWKMKIDESNTNQHGQTRRNGRKKIKIDELGFRQHCRIRCGAETVIRNVLPYLLPG